ncbi:MAG: ribonuclease HI [Rhodospirillaceae bacterium]|nr:ribonuclease HI [Rhodospirillaceae bacterium]|tara:strand:- start:824 stop:1264 length:441 start_codon:yes stop_codon:yes gene_type:complete
MTKVKIYTDGACSGNPGPGGWGAQLIYNDSVKEISGYEANTTNNRMELIAVISSLEYIEINEDIEIYTDSVYVMDGITKWIKNWKKNKWLTSAKKPVKNEDLWKKLDKLCKAKKINWSWVKGHSGNKGNERADYLARKAISTNLSG